MVATTQRVKVQPAHEKDLWCAANLVWRKASNGRARTTVKMSCARGHVGYLEDHEIDDRGRVSPSVDCPENGCDFHAWILLVGWDV